MASSKATVALATAAAVGGACAFVAPSAKTVSATPALRGQVRSTQASGLSPNAAAAVALSSAAVLVSQARKAGSKTSALKAFEQELGVQPPVGYWDPAGLARDGDVEAFQRRRSVELKHGRIAMLATMGYITPEIAGKFPGYLSPSAGLKFADVPNGLAAISKVPAGGWTQILLYMGWCEVSRGPGSDIASGRPGDFGWYVLSSADPEQKKKKLSAELANGRLAMMAIIGMFYQDGLTGSAWGDWSNFTDSPLRATGAWRAASRGLLGPCWLGSGWGRGGLPAQALRRAQARPHCHARDHGLMPVHASNRRIFVPQRGVEVR
ncbi:Fucoxanthin-chlorophyll a-c binding protein F [Durusdinium trenchii]|uniref:Chloroplastic n=1 Tax=Durusdinium trenchii TaxID=1381693 RepID=A0ABP0JSF3_9DINO